MEAIIYTKAICPYCQMAKQFLSNHDIAYTEVLFDDDAARQAMYDDLGLIGQQRSVPQIFLAKAGQTTRIGGYSDLLESELAVGDFSEDF